MKKTTMAILISLAIPIALFALRSGHDDSTPDFVTVLPDPIPSKSAYPEREYTFPSKLMFPDYQIISENNLFRPLGWTREAPPPIEPAALVVPEPIIQTPAAPPPTYTLVLTGIVQNGSDWIAVIEDRQHNEGLFLRRGEMLKDVVVHNIGAEHIQLVRGELTAQLALGESIEYGVDGQVLVNTAGTLKTPKPTDQTSKPAETQMARDGGDGQSLIERMRARRRRELNQ